MGKYTVLSNKKNKQQNLTISLVIPAYNEHEYIGPCLEYALRNAWWYIDEIIVIDNASTDDTKKIAEKYEGPQDIESKKQGAGGRQQSVKYQTPGTHTRLLVLAAPTACDIVFIIQRPSMDRPAEMVEKYAGPQEIGSKKQGAGGRQKSVKY